ncbi:hypothetical protein ANO11243_046710 [Dothideomycetidae sp. 11243]|nr:hypothetical protein ANO11243_046710 [fungal sp. No.11243]
MHSLIELQVVRLNTLELYGNPRGQRLGKQHSIHLAAMVILAAPGCHCHASGGLWTPCIGWQLAFGAGPVSPRHRRPSQANRSESRRAWSVREAMQGGSAAKARGWSGLVWSGR